MTSRLHEPDECLAVLIDVVRQMSATFELEPLLRSAERAGLTALRCERATIFLYDAGADELYSIVATGTEGIRFSARLGVAGEAARERCILVVPDAYADSRFNPEIDRQTGFRTRNILSVPLLDPDGQLIGVLQLLNKQQGQFDDRDELLAQGLGSLIGITIKRQMLLDAEAQKERLEHDLDLARQIQLQMLPSKNPQVPGFDVAGWNRPADQTGGDCYGFLPLSDARLAFLVADASGHGIGPALVVTQCRAMIRAIAEQTDDLSLIAAKVNNLLCQDLPAGRFVTVCYGILDPRAESLRYVSAGHGPLLLLRAATSEIEVFGATGLPMAIIEETEYHQVGPFNLAPGDLFCLLTDGFVEWSRADGEQYGLERMFDVLRHHRKDPCAEIIQAIYRDVLAFSEGSVQADDLTAVLIKKS